MPIRKQSLFVLSKYALSIGLLWLLIDHIDVNASWSAAQKVSPDMLVAALLLEVVQFIIVTFRWKYVMYSIGSLISFSKALELLCIGMFLGQVLPGAVGGDVVRMWKTRQAGLSVSASINSVLLERIATVLGLVLFLTVTSPFILTKYYKFSFNVWIFPMFMVAGIAGVGIIMMFDRAPKIFERWVMAHHFSSLAHDTRLLFLKPKKAVWLMALVVVGLVNLCLQVWVLALGLGIPLTVLDSLLLVPPVVLLAYLPITLGGWGVREAAMVGALGLVGVSGSQSLVVSILFGLVGLVVSLPGFVFWMKAKREKVLKT